EEFTEAVLVTADDAIAAALVERRASARRDFDGLKPVAPRAVAKYQAWKNGPYRRNLDVASNLFADRLGEPAAQTFFASLITNASLGEFVYTIDPSSTEEMTLGQFLPEELTEREKRRAQRQLAREQRRGRAIGVRLDDLGTWNTWVSAT